MQIADLGNKVSIVPAEGDTSTTIADLAQFVEFDSNNVRRFDTSIACVAFHALEEEYSNHEMVAGEADYYEGVWMTFADGSTIRIVN